MLTFFDKIKRLIINPGLLNAYLNWVISHGLYRKAPSIACTSDTKINDWISFSEYWTFIKVLSEAEKNLIKSCLNNINKKESVAIDIGANIGFFTLLLASIGYSEVHAFEPIPQTFSRLKANLANNHMLDKVTLNCMAVGSSEGIVEFNIFEDSPASNSLATPSTDQTNISLKQQVAVTTLDRYCAERGIYKIDFLKIDVEGMELFVIQGASNLLKEKRISTILIEICPYNLNGLGLSVNDLYNSIINLGYLPHVLLESGEVGDILEISDLQNIILANVVLIPA